jgi:hypothetical protein
MWRASSAPKLIERRDVYRRVSKANEEFLGDWSGPLADVTAALNAKFGRNRTVPAIRSKVKK